jgi:hypothetical protein
MKYRQRPRILFNVSFISKASEGLELNNGDSVQKSRFLLKRNPAAHTFR